MCGIAGLWLFESNKSTDLTNTIDCMVNSISHRGPDNEGIWINSSGRIGLGHRRLSVIDLSQAGNQPMQSLSGRFVIVFNGEIYNHHELRIRLGAENGLKYHWRGSSDTETLLASIEYLGIRKTLQSCKGMFAFALWDKELKELHLCRDRFGEKPLYWGVIDDVGIGFASEISSFNSIQSFSKRINKAAIHGYKFNGFISAPQSIYQGLFQLLPGSIVTIKADSQGQAPHYLPKPFLWWDSEKESSNAAKSYLTTSHNDPVDLLNKLHGLLKEAVKIEAIADVPLCSFLSGGIDSSLITALLQETTGRNIRSFTIAFPEESKFNEAPFAKAIANHLGTEHTEVSLTASDAQSLIPDLPKLYSEPFADSSQLPTHLLCREAKRAGLTVALTGDGGDELFGGYNRHRLAPEIYRKLRYFPNQLKRLLTKSIRHAPLGLLGIASDGLAQEKRQKLAAAIEASYSLEAMQAVLLRSCSIKDIDRSSLNPLPNASTEEEQLMLADVLNYLPSDILVKVDRASMAVGLETRAPFLDYSVAQMAWQLPLEYKVQKPSTQKTGKWALREILKHYVPDQLFERPKAGFAMPIGVWLRGPLKTWANDLLDPSLLQQYGWFDPDEVSQTWKKHLIGESDQMARLWPILMAQAWLAEWSGS